MGQESGVVDIIFLWAAISFAASLVIVLRWCQRPSLVGVPDWKTAVLPSGQPITIGYDRNFRCRLAGHLQLWVMQQTKLVDWKTTKCNVGRSNTDQLLELILSTDHLR